MTDFLARNWGNLASVAGLVFSILAFVFAKRASAAAREARDAAMRQSLGESMNDAARVAGEVVVYLSARKNEAAYLRVGDLMNQISYFRGRWQDRLSKKSTDNLSRALGQLRTMHQLLSAGTHLKEEDEARLAMSCQEVSEVLSVERGIAVRGAEAVEEK
jgi:hypothetical protein